MLLRITHTGTKKSLEILEQRGKRSFRIILTDGIIKVSLPSKKSYKSLIPSVEGDTIICQLPDGNQILYDSSTGKILTDKETRSRKITIYK